MHNDCHCRVCGFLHDSPPWGPSGIDPSFEICACCGVEFGYEDATLSAVRNYRMTWCERGCPWFEPQRRPATWSAEEQMKGIPEEYRG
jgi:hypothetical protein